MAARWRTSVVLAGTACLVVLGLLSSPKAHSWPLGAPGNHDVDLYTAVVSRVHAGEPYYRVAGDELERRGYATAPAFNWRLPTLAEFQAVFPSLRWSAAVLTLLGLATTFLWGDVFWRDRRRLVSVAAVLLMLPMMAAWLNPRASVFHEVWAGELIALSLGCWARGFPRASTVAGMAALAVRELALPFVVLMMTFAFFERRRREAAAWAVAVLLFFVYLGAHEAMVTPLIPRDALHNRWLAFGGWGFALDASRFSLALIATPWRLNAILVPVALAGLYLWGHAAGPRLALTVTVYLAMFCVIGRPDNTYWGFLIGPILPLGLVGGLVALQTAFAGKVQERKL